MKTNILNFASATLFLVLIISLNALATNNKKLPTSVSIRIGHASSSAQIIAVNHGDMVQTNYCVPAPLQEDLEDEEEQTETETRGPIVYTAPHMNIVMHIGHASPNAQIVAVNHGDMVQTNYCVLPPSQEDPEEEEASTENEEELTDSETNTRQPSVSIEVGHTTSESNPNRTMINILGNMSGGMISGYTRGNVRVETHYYNSNIK